jgi:hypothetical protein
MQQYFGNDAHGLPVPRSFPCVRCGGACELDSMVLRPAPGVPDDATERFIVAWEDRAAGGRFRRFWRTSLDGAVHPKSIGLAAAFGADPWAACWYLSRVSAWVVLPTSAMVAAIWTWQELLSSSRTLRGPGGLAVLGWDAAAWIAVTVGVVIGIIAAVAATSATATLALRLLGEQVRWRVLWAIHAYTAGPLLIAAVPCLGPYCAGWVVWVWCLVATIVALTFGVAVPAWKAVVAALVGPILGAVLAALVVFFVVQQAMTAMPGATAAPVTVDGQAFPADPDVSGEASLDGTTPAEEPAAP